MRTIFGSLLATVSTTGELGTIANWEQHLLPGAWERPEAELVKMLGAGMPADCLLPRTYDGPPRVVVPAVRTSLEPGEPLALEVLVLSKAKPGHADLFWRPMGRGAFAKVPLEHKARGVFKGDPPALGRRDRILHRGRGRRRHGPVPRDGPGPEPDRDRPPGGEMSETILLPKRLRAPEVAAFLAEIRRKSADGGLTVDFREVEEFDGSTLAFLAHLTDCEPGLAVVNVPGALARAGARFSEAARRSLARKDRGGAVRQPARAGSSEPWPTASSPASGSWGSSWPCSATRSTTSASTSRTRKGVYPGETWNQMFFMGYRSFPIVCLLLFLVGVTISITSADQMRLFGAEIYIADLVGYAMLRELVPLMTGVILAGKVGAAVTAELASMSVLEEVDALRTMGVVPEKFLMVPRLLAITLVVPLLVAMADVAGVFGGMRRRPDHVRHAALGLPQADGQLRGLDQFRLGPRQDRRLRLGRRRRRGDSRA